MITPEPPNTLLWLAASLLVGEGEPPDHCPERTDMSLVQAAREHRCLGLVIDAMDRGVLRASPAVRTQGLDLHAIDMHRCLVAEATLNDLGAQFAEAGVEPIVLKGVALAHLAYPDPAWRAFQDVDLLIPTEQIDAATDALVRAGLRRDLCERRRGWDRRFAKDITFDHPSGVEIDLHRTLAPGAFGFWIDEALLVGNPAMFTLGSQSHRALGPEARVLHAVYSLTVAEQTPRLCHALDLALTLRSSDRDQFLGLAMSSRAGLLVEEALALLRRWLGPASVPSGWWPPGMGSGRRLERLARRTYRSGGGSNTTTLLGGAVAVSGFRARAAYVGGLLWPSSEYRSQRAAGNRPNELRTGLRELVQRSRG